LEYGKLARVSQVGKKLTYELMLRCVRDHRPEQSEDMLRDACPSALDYRGGNTDTHQASAEGRACLGAACFSTRYIRKRTVGCQKISLPATNSIEHALG